MICWTTLGLALAGCATTPHAPPSAGPVGAGAARIVGGDELKSSGLPSTGDALRRRLPLLGYSAPGSRSTNR